jgi:hypothetical protein
MKIVLLLSLCHLEDRFVVEEVHDSIPNRAVLFGHHRLHRFSIHEQHLGRRCGHYMLILGNYLAKRRFPLYRPLLLASLHPILFPDLQACRSCRQVGLHCSCQVRKQENSVKKQKKKRKFRKHERRSTLIFPRPPFLTSLLADLSTSPPPDMLSIILRQRDPKGHAVYTFQPNAILNNFSRYPHSNHWAPQPLFPISSSTPTQFITFPILKSTWKKKIKETIICH